MTGVLKVDGEVGHKKAYDQHGLGERVKQAVKELRATGTTMVKRFTCVDRDLDFTIARLGGASVADVQCFVHPRR